MTMFLIWVACSILACVLIYFKQKRYLTELQPLAIFMFGPLALLMALALPASWFTTREQAERR